MAVTIKEVAERAGVSRSAVSRTFTEGASVSEKTRRKVRLAAEALGYSPNLLAGSLTTRRTKLIGLISSNFRNPAFLQVFDIFTRGLQERGLRPLLVNLTDDSVSQETVRLMRQYSVDGVIIASSTLPANYALAFREAGIPVVHSFGRATSSPEVHVVGIDNRTCGKMAAECLVARGYRSVAFMGGPEAATSTRDRLDGFMAEMARHPDVAVSHSFSEAYSFQAGRSEMERLLAQTPAEAYFCGDDVLSIGALSAVKSAGLDVPRDIGIIGLNDMEMAGWENIDLTTIHQPIPEIIASSIDLIVAMLDEPNRYPEARLFPCHIVERGTLRPLGTSVA